MRSYFRPDICTQLFRQFHHFYCIFRTDMLNVHAGTGMKRQHTVTCHESILSQCRRTIDSKSFCRRSRIDSVFRDECRILLVEAERHIQLLRLKHRSLHQILVHDRNTVIGKPGCTCCFQSLHIYQFLSLHSNSDTCSWKHVDSGLLTFLQNILHSLHIIHRRFGIGHRHNGCKAALFRRCRTGLNIFFISKARITEMHMHIDKTRCHYHAICINDLIIFTGRFHTTNRYNLSTVNYNVLYLIQTALRVDHASVLN